MAVGELHAFLFFFSFSIAQEGASVSFLKNMWMAAFMYRNSANSYSQSSVLAGEHTRIPRLPP